jgi:two-component system response regulator HydG
VNPSTDRLPDALKTLGTLNSRLLQLSSEISPHLPEAKSLIRDLLGSVRTVRENVESAISGAGTEDVTSAHLNKEIERLTMLLGVAGLFHSTLDADEIAVRILDSVLGWAGADRGVLLLQDPSTGEHVVKVGREITESVYRSADVTLPRRIVAQVLTSREPFFSTDVQGDTHLMVMASIRDLKIRALACMPLISEEEVLGIIYFDYQAATRRIGSEEKATLKEVCAQASAALQNVSRYQRARLWARKSSGAGLGRLIGTCPEMRRVFELINQVASSPSTSVLITGSSGTGKELVAQAIHELSSRIDDPFVAVNCAALPPTLLESELFGHEKGAFTDAKTRRIGLIEQADKGTLFLDEIADMPVSLQTKLLRVLESRTIRRIGGTEDITVDIRVIAATNRDIGKAVSDGEFREDLFYRLSVFPIALPSLADRGDDVIWMANALIIDLNTTLGTKTEPIDPGSPVAGALKSYNWPGNVRELRNVLERAMILCRGREIKLSDLPAPICPPTTDRITSPTYADASNRTETAPPPGVSRPDYPAKTLKGVEDEYIDRVLTASHGSKKRASQILGIDLTTLYRKLKKRGS